jgi:8-oxo-dGTP diphosphatase
MPDIVHVAVAVIVNKNNEVCISLRHKNAHQGGLWEFPGGKVEQGENIKQALAREIREELDLEIKQSRPLITINHVYHDKAVCLHVCKVILYQGEATGLEGQQVKWLPVTQLSAEDFPAANLPVIKALQLPDKYLITGKFTDSDDFIYKLKNALNNGIKLVQLRLKDNVIIAPPSWLSAKYRPSVDIKDKGMKENGRQGISQLQFLLEQSAELCKQAEVNLMLNLSADYLHSIDLSNIEFAGFHADSKTLNILSQRPVEVFKERPRGSLFSASCHNMEELLLASKLNADFVVLSPVQKTASHPDMPAMGWQQFSNLIENISIPVYALGGVSENDLEAAWQHGAQGIAAISALWETAKS